MVQVVISPMATLFHEPDIWTSDKRSVVVPSPSGEAQRVKISVQSI
jgi:hypothetical protein